MIDHDPLLDMARRGESVYDDPGPIEANDSARNDPQNAPRSAADPDPTPAGGPTATDLLRAVLSSYISHNGTHSSLDPECGPTPYRYTAYMLRANLIADIRRYISDHPET